MSKQTGFLAGLLAVLSGTAGQAHDDQATEKGAEGDAGATTAEDMQKLLADNQRLQEQAKAMAVAAADGFAAGVVARAITEDKLVPAQADEFKAIVLNALATDGGGAVAVVDGKVVTGEQYNTIVNHLENAKPLGLQKQTVPAGAVFVETGKTMKPEHTVAGILGMTHLGREAAKGKAGA